MHRMAFTQALVRLFSKPFASLLSALVIAIALTLPAAGYVIISEFGGLADGVSGKPEISVFLKNEVPSARATAIVEGLRADKRISALRFVSRDDALKQLAARGGFADVVGVLDHNPLPDAFIVEPAGADPALFEDLRKSFAALPEVAHVQLDSAWVERLHAIVALGQRVVLTLAGLLGAALVIVIFNTIRLQILTQRHEIAVSMLVGATRAYVRRPFLYFGAVQGLLGGLLAWGLVVLLLGLIVPQILELARTYSVVIDFQGLRWWQILVLLAFASTLGWLGAGLSVMRHLHDRPPVQGS